MNQILAQQVGNYVVTPMAKLTENGYYAASVSIRRGAYDRVFRLIPRFRSAMEAADYALSQGRGFALQPALA